MKFFEQIQRLERMDQLIRLKATGTPKEFANRLSLSERSIYDLVNAMKRMGAPIAYSHVRQSYVYEEHGRFRCQVLFERNLQEQVTGGFTDFFLGLQENYGKGVGLGYSCKGESRKPCR